MIAVFAAILVAAAPPGFYESRVLEPASSFVAGKPAHVYCSNTVTDFRDWRRQQGGDFINSGAATFVGASETYLSTTICAPIRQRLASRKIDQYELAGSLTALVHEAIHMRGQKDEAATECAAMHELPRVAVKFFKFRAGKQLRSFMAQAWAFHRTLPPEYQSAC